MDTTLELRPALSRLKMSGIMENLDERIRQANESKLGYSEFLFSIMQDEVERRDNQALALRLRRSNLDLAKTMETFNLNADPKIPVKLIRELATCSFLDKAENAIFIGATGAGKSHVASAIGHEACRRGKDVRFDRVNDMLSGLNSGRADESYDRKLKWLTDIPLLIIDDFGLIELSNREQIDLYEIICRRYERRSTIITSNRDIKEWFGAFDNALIASAAIDRLMHRGIKVVLERDSHRFNESIQLNAKYGLTGGKE